MDDQCPLFVAARGERSGGQRVRRWFVLSAMRNGRSISKLTGRNISLSFWGRSFVIPSSLAARDKLTGRNISLSFWGRSSVIHSSLAARDCIVPK